MKRFTVRRPRLLAGLSGALGFGFALTLNATSIDWAAYDPAMDGTYQLEGNLDGYPATIVLEFSNVATRPGTYTMEMTMSVPAIHHHEVTTIQVENGVYDPTALVLDDTDINFDRPPPQDQELRRGTPIQWASSYSYWDYEIGEIKGQLALRVKADEEELLSLPIGDFRAQRVSLLIETEESWKENAHYYGGTVSLDLDMDMAFARGVGPVLIQMDMFYRDTFGPPERIFATFELTHASIPLMLATVEGEALRELWGHDTIILHGWFWNPRQSYFWAWPDGWIYENDDFSWATGTTEARHRWNASTGNWYFEANADFPWIYGYTEEAWLIP